MVIWLPRLWIILPDFPGRLSVRVKEILKTNALKHKTGQKEANM